MRSKLSKVGIVFVIPQKCSHNFKNKVVLLLKIGYNLKLTNDEVVRLYLCSHCSWFLHSDCFDSLEHIHHSLCLALLQSITDSTVHT